MTIIILFPNSITNILYNQLSYRSFWKPQLQNLAITTNVITVMYFFSIIWQSEQFADDWSLEGKYSYGHTCVFWSCLFLYGLKRICQVHVVSCFSYWFVYVALVFLQQFVSYTAKVRAWPGKLCKRFIIFVLCLLG